MRKHALFACTLLLSLLAAGAAVHAQQSTDSAYMAQVMTAAPAAVVKGATIVQMQNGGAMRTLQKGSNGFTCMMLPGGPGTPMCADQNAMEWMHALMTHSAPPDKVGFIYMLAGDQGASNSDPYAAGPSSGNHWIKTGPHVMIVGPSAKSMGYPAALDADPSKPYVMWPGTPYAHLMIPVSSTPQ